VSTTGRFALEIWAASFSMSSGAVSMRGADGTVRGLAGGVQASISVSVETDR
jgi:hypothetical protein